MNRIFYLLIPGVLSVLLSCTKTEAGFTPQGGELPAHYIIMKDSSFSPAILTVVSGTTIRFLNQTGLEQRITSSDSITIAPVSIPANGFYHFKANNFGIINYHYTNRPGIKGLIIATP